jgi:crotonobetainyl-CoA:carnitine CoA-transferase CaiB-like acyl-CoA transferase
MALLIGLLSRSKTGEGQYIDVAFSDCAVTIPPGRLPDEMLLGRYPCYNIYETKDGRYITLSIREPWFWERLCKLLGREEWIPTIRPEGELREEMFRFFRKVFKEKTQAEWLQILKENDIEFGPLNLTVEELKSDPHLKAREMVLEFPDPVTGGTRYEPGFVFKFSGTPAELRWGPTLVGAHTEAVLRELGYSDGELAQLRESGAIA